MLIQFSNSDPNSCIVTFPQLVTDYASFLTASDEVRAKLLHGIELHRRKYPDFKTFTLKGSV